MIRTIAAALFATLMAGTALAQGTAPATGTPRASAPPPPMTNGTMPAPSTRPATGATAAPMAANQYAAESAAKAACPADTVVWVNLGGSKAYHMSGDKYYGKTKKGTYMCQKEADTGGFHVSGRRGAKAAAKS